MSFAPQLPNPAKLHAAGGFSLVELMTGAVCTVLFLGATMSLVTQNGRQRQLNREISLASNAAFDCLETLRNLDIAALPAQDGVGFDVPAETGTPGGLNPAPGDADGLCGSFDVSIAQSSGSLVLYRVTAQVTWSGVSGVRTFSFQTLMGDRR